MNNTSNKITSAGNLPDINFEDLIKVTNVTPRILNEDGTDLEGNDIDKPKSTNDLASKSAGFTKIAPKPITTTTTTTTKNGSNSGHVVLIQGPSGTPQPIRISGVNPSTGAKQTPVTIQVLKMPDGSLVQIKNNKALNLTNLSNVAQVNIGSKKNSGNTSQERIVIKTTGGMILSSQSKLAMSSAGSLGPTVLKSLTVAEAQRAGFLKAKTTDSTKLLQKILPASSTAASTSSVSNTVNASSNSIKNTITGKTVILKTEKETGTKQIVVPQQVVKLSQNTTGSIQAIQIPGKPGVQYVRVLGTTGSASSSTAKVLNSLPTIRPKDSSPTKLNVVTSLPGSSAHRIIMNAKQKPTTSYLNVSKALTGGTQIISKGNTKTLITTPTLRKISDAGGTKLLTVIKKEESRDDISGTTKLKIGQLSNIPAKRIKFQTGPSNGTDNQQTNSKMQYVMVPQELFKKMQSSNETNINVSSDFSEGSAPKKLYSVLKPSPDVVEETAYVATRKRTPSPDGLRRKHCNCTKSLCLKLYCDCFANGEFCQDCNCKECFNNLEYEDERQKAIKICLERNPNAFKPKITKARDQSDLRLHNKGCNCKRSGCLKNYCECYEAKIACSSNCKCFGCRNVEDRSEMDPYEVAKIAQNFGRGITTKRPHEETVEKPAPVVPSQQTTLSQQNKQPYNFITQDVVDATIQCMIAQADECKKGGVSNQNTERMILEELGRCLVEIIDFSIRNMDS